VVPWLWPALPAVADLFLTPTRYVTVPSMHSKMQFLKYSSLLGRSMSPEPCSLISLLWGLSRAVADGNDTLKLEFVLGVSFPSVSPFTPLMDCCSFPSPQRFPAYEVMSLSKSSNRFTEWPHAALPGTHVQVLPYSDTLYRMVQLANIL